MNRRGRRAASDAYVVLTAPGGSREQPRLGLTVSRKVGNAVVRNRVKRRIREWFRDEGRAHREALDIVVIARRKAVELPFETHRALLSQLVAQATAR